MRIFSTEQLGPRQSLTPEGYLLCEAVPIARTGSQLYAAHELPFLESGLDGLITVVREEAEVFSPATMSSFEGKSVTIGHAFVDPDSWSTLTKGTVQNVRRGDGVQVDLLLADLLITDAEAIEAVREKLDDKGRPLPGHSPLREVSCGYEADYVQDRPGVAFQRNIIGNHVALVERGRAGPRCAIQDEDLMTTKTPQPSLLARLIAAAKTEDTALIKRTADAAEEEEKKRIEDEEAELERKETKDAIADLKKTVDALVEAIKSKDEIGPDAGQSSTAGKIDDGTNPIGDEEPTEEEKKQTADAMRDVLSRAEILAPGFKMPTADAAPRRLADVAGVQRKVLADATRTADGAALVSPLLAGRTVDALSAAEVATVFVAAAEMARVQNNSRAARQGIATKDQNLGGAVSNADINARNAAFWNKKS